jgi:serine/threonine protein phosphatase PrpC
VGDRDVIVMATDGMWDVVTNEVSCNAFMYEFPQTGFLPCRFVVPYSIIPICKDGDTVEKQAGHRIIELRWDDRQI